MIIPGVEIEQQGGTMTGNQGSKPREYGNSRELSRGRLPHIAVIVIDNAAVALLGFAQSGLSLRYNSLPKDEPQAVYHPDPADAWNRIFYYLFTRTVKTRLSQDFSEGAPFTSVQMIGFPELRVSTNLFERIEERSCDRSTLPFLHLLRRAGGPNQSVAPGSRSED
jgi:hypothetical protein